MDVYFKSYKTGMVTVKEKYPCDRGDGKGRNHVFTFANAIMERNLSFQAMNFLAILIRAVAPLNQ